MRLIAELFTAVPVASMSAFHPFLPLAEWRLSTHSGHYNQVSLTRTIPTPIQLIEQGDG